MRNTISDIESKHKSADARSDNCIRIHSPNVIQLKTPLLESKLMTASNQIKILN
jgi:hypothetical protein